MLHQFHFTFENIEKQYQKALELGYEVITCAEYCEKKKTKNLSPRTIVNRIDIDFSVKKASRLLESFNRLSIRGTFFLRLHAPEYNPFDFENYSILKRISDSGNEIGYHSEVIDQSAIWNDDPIACLHRDLAVMEAMFGYKVKGVASHGGLTGLNNLDFWKDRRASDFGLLYEAYDNCETFNLFFESFYITDSEWTRWKCYEHGNRRVGDHRTLDQHLDDAHALVYLLIHPDTYFERHFYE